VKGPSPDKVSTRSAASNAVTKVEKSSFADATSAMVPASAGASTVVLVSDVLSSDPHAANSINDAAAIAAIFFFIIFS
jgi:hypothetical protein